MRVASESISSGGIRATRSNGSADCNTTDGFNRRESIRSGIEAKEYGG